MTIKITGDLEFQSDSMIGHDISYFNVYYVGKGLYEIPNNTATKSDCFEKINNLISSFKEDFGETYESYNNLKSTNKLIFGFRKSKLFEDMTRKCDIINWGKMIFNKLNKNNKENISVKIQSDFPLYMGENNGDDDEENYCNECGEHLNDCRCNPPRVIRDTYLLEDDDDIEIEDVNNNGE
jgi:hypothetical protein